LNHSSYLASLTFADVEAAAREAERLFQEDPHVVPARRAAAWASLVESMERAAATAVGDLGSEATKQWETELGFSGENNKSDADWPGDRASLERPRNPPKRRH
jgi:hypothetical protein